MRTVTRIRVVATLGLSIGLFVSGYSGIGKSSVVNCTSYSSHRMGSCSPWAEI
jgi:hypothetical protein